MPAPIRAVIFDFDGLVVDTESTGYLTWKDIFDQHGHHLPVERYAQAVGTDPESPLQTGRGSSSKGPRTGYGTRA